MLSVVCWKWKPPVTGYRSTFDADAVHTLARMVKRHYPHPHRIVCVTDDPKGLDASIDVVPLWKDLADVPSPHGAHQPSCYRRLKAFSAEAEQWFGPRFVSVDLDCVIVGDMSSLWNRTEDFVIWGETDPRSFYNGSMWMMTAGSRRKVWDTFDPRTSPGLAKRNGKFGSDQGWISHCLGRGQAMWGRKHGVYSFRVHMKNGMKPLPPDAKIVFFHGKHDPWGYVPQQLSWVQQHYK